MMLYMKHEDEEAVTVCLSPCLFVCLFVLTEMFGQTKVMWTELVFKHTHVRSTYIVFTVEEALRSFS